MDPILISLLSGLAGAIIGSIGTVLTVLITSRQEANRHRWELIYKGALDEMQLDFQAAKHTGKSFVLPPLAAYLHYHLMLVRVMESGDITRQDAQKMSDQWKDTWPRRKN